MSERVAIILAAGQGKRMNSDLPKVLHPIGGRPMIERVMDTARAAGFNRIVVVVGHGREQVKDVISGEGVEFAVQDEQLGTGHAVEMAATCLDGFDGQVSVLCGDVPLLSVDTLRALRDTNETNHYAGTVLTMILDDPTGYGRVYRTPGGEVAKIVEHRDLPEGDPGPDEVNSGTYCFDWAALRPALKELKTDNDQGEYYLTDVVSILREKGASVGASVTEDPIETSGINNPEQLAELDRAWRARNA
jgi:bifunctional UDP-N-acetylglucosamine pyrophosphorylase/glucosamine-1-phosphate N-acetyltransferase